MKKKLNRSMVVLELACGTGFEAEKIGGGLSENNLYPFQRERSTRR